MNTKFWIDSAVCANADARMNNESVRKLWNGFTFAQSALTLTPGTANCFCIGSAPSPTLPADAEYALCVTPTGAAVVGRDYNTLMHGYAALLRQIEFEPETGRLFLAVGEARDSFRLANRMIHFCIFPETDLLTLRRQLRFCAVLGFSHVVLEFWGTLRLDTAPSLAWKEAFSKDTVADLLSELRELGMEPIPMFNHLGHAAASRGVSGKHTTLDQDPTMYRHFTPDGWSWNTYNPETRALLRSVRAELYELYGAGEYFHAGLDESYMYAASPKLFADLPAYLHDLTCEIAAEGRRPMIWMDMFLPPEAYQHMRKHACTTKTPEQCNAILKALHPSTILVDWQYHEQNAPLPTSLYLKDSGLSIMGAPWLNRGNSLAHVETVAQNDLFGIMQTTWHTLAMDFPGILLMARGFGSTSAPWEEYSDIPSACATLLRKVSFEPLSYNQTGWMDLQILLGSELPRTY